MQRLKKLTYLTNKNGKISKKGYDFLLGKMHFTGNYGHQNFLAFAPILSSLILDKNKKFTGISPENIKRFGTGHEPAMSSLTNGGALLKLNNSISVQKGLPSMYSNFILSLYIVCELNNWSRNPTNDFSL